MSRVSPWLGKPDEHWTRTRDQLNSTTLFLMARNGPCVFTIGDESGQSYRTILGNPNQCSCVGGSSSGSSGSGGAAADKRQCIHVLFCLIKVLKIVETHPLCFQNSLLDSELDQLLSGNLSTTRADRDRGSGRSRRLETSTTAASISTPSVDGSQESFVTRHALSDDDPEYCPICQDDMSADQALTWCRRGCGNNMHAKCMRTFVQYNISKRSEPQCPYCREKWAMEFLNSDCRGQSSSLKHSCAPVSCTACNLTVRGSFYRCIECSQAHAYPAHRSAIATVTGVVTANGMNVSATNSLGINTDQTVASSSPAAAAAVVVANKKARRPLDFCQPCFTRMRRAGHTTHHFMQSLATVDTINDVTWTVVPNAVRKAMDLSTLMSLQNRDLSNNDYDMLLGLDNQQEVVSLSVHAINALPIATESNSQIVCWCCVGSTEANSGIGGSSSEPTRRLPCGHIAHDRCINDVIAAFGDDLVDIDKIACRHSDCGKAIFRGLGRRRKERKKAAPSVASQVPAAASSTESAIGVIASAVSFTGSIADSGASSMSTRRSSHRKDTGLRTGLALVMSVNGTRCDSAAGGDISIDVMPVLSTSTPSSSTSSALLTIRQNRPIKTLPVIRQARHQREDDTGHHDTITSVGQSLGIGFRAQVASRGDHMQLLPPSPHDITEPWQQQPQQQIRQRQRPVKQTGLPCKLQASKQHSGTRTSGSVMNRINDAASSSSSSSMPLPGLITTSYGSLLAATGRSITNSHHDS